MCSDGQDAEEQGHGSPLGSAQSTSCKTEEGAHHAERRRRRCSRRRWYHVFKKLSNTQSAAWHTWTYKKIPMIHKAVCCLVFLRFWCCQNRWCSYRLCWFPLGGEVHSAEQPCRRVLWGRSLRVHHTYNSTWSHSVQRCQDTGTRIVYSFYFSTATLLFSLGC